MERCECGVCDTAFTDDTVVEMAESVADHWNDEHGDEFHGEQPYRTEEHGHRHLHGNEYAVRQKEYYITVYDVLNPDGEQPFKYQWVKKPEAVDVCEDCWRSIESVDEYRELPVEGWRDQYLCGRCEDARRIKRRKDENESLEEFTA